MGLNQTPSGERMHISIFGRRNSGKSSLINALTGQKLAIAPDLPGCVSTGKTLADAERNIKEAISL